jgi:epimerase transport system membrane fusion protein
MQTSSPPANPQAGASERTAFGLEGQIADANANIAKARQAIAEQEQQIAQLDNDRMADITKDLRDTQAKMLEVIPKAMNAGPCWVAWKSDPPMPGGWWR